MEECFQPKANFDAFTLFFVLNFRKHFLQFVVNLFRIGMRRINVQRCLHRLEGVLKITLLKRETPERDSRPVRFSPMLPDTSFYRSCNKARTCTARDSERFADTLDPKTQTTTEVNGDRWWWRSFTISAFFRWVSTIPRLLYASAWSLLKTKAKRKHWMASEISVVY